jgi:hypothetical protein
VGGRRLKIARDSAAASMAVHQLFTFHPYYIANPPDCQAQIPAESKNIFTGPPGPHPA